MVLAVPGDVSVGSLAVIRDHDNDVEIGCAVPLQVSSNLIGECLARKTAVAVIDPYRGVIC